MTSWHRDAFSIVQGLQQWFPLTMDRKCRIVMFSLLLSPVIWNAITPVWCRDNGQKPNPRILKKRPLVLQWTIYIYIAISVQYCKGFGKAWQMASRKIRRPLMTGTIMLSQTTICLVPFSFQNPVVAIERIPIIKLRPFYDPLIFIMGILIPQKTVFVLKWLLWSPKWTGCYGPINVTFEHAQVHFE